MTYLIWKWKWNEIVMKLKKSCSLNQNFVVHKDRMKLFSCCKWSLFLKEKIISSKADNTTRSNVMTVLIHDDNIDLVNEIHNFLFLSYYKFYSYSETASEFHSLSDCNYDRCSNELQKEQAPDWLCMIITIREYTFISGDKELTSYLLLLVIA